MLQNSKIRPQGSITTRLYGGMGNQLFQYAAGRAVAIANQTELLLDTRWFNGKLDRTYMLDHFQHKGIVADESMLPPAKAQGAVQKIVRQYQKWSGKRLMERANSFDPRIGQAGKGTYLYGYWQVPNYFVSIADKLRQELTVAAPPSNQNKELLNLIAGTYCVSVHVRRGDYIINPKNSGRFATCTPDYYRRAAQLICENDAGDPTFLLFSDDPAWVKENIDLQGRVIVVDHNDSRSAHEDLRLMAACRHNIIANSTFSWWGAWLNPNQGKLIVAPKIWYYDPDLSNDFIMPGDWTQIEN